MKRCAKCGKGYEDEFDACPWCAKVQSWGTTVLLVLVLVWLIASAVAYGPSLWASVFHR